MVDLTKLYKKEGNYMETCMNEYNIIQRLEKGDDQTTTFRDGKGCPFLSLLTVILVDLFSQEP